MSPIALVHALLLTAALTSPALPRDPAERVRALGERYREHLLEHRPDLALRWGVQGARPRLEPLTEATLERDAAIVAALQAEVAELGSAPLDAEHASLVRMLAGRLAEEQAQVGEGGELWREPFAWVRLLRGTLERALAEARRSPCERAQLMTPLLASAPELWRGASIVMRGPAGGPGLRDSLESARQWLREELPPLALACRDAPRLGLFVQADSLAIRALERYGAFLLGDPSFAPGRRTAEPDSRGAAGR